MIKTKYRFIKITFILTLIVSLFACQKFIPQNIEERNNDYKIVENGYYTSKEDVSLYLRLYDELPKNYITKNEASALGWNADKGNLWDVSDKKSIGGDRFYNREGLLPQVEGIIYFECDIDYTGGYRNSKRIVFSNNGYIYYTDDHYDSFEQLYEGE